MGTMTIDPEEMMGTVGKRVNKDDYLGYIEEKDLWEILRSQIIEPVERKGYADVSFCVGDRVPVEEVRRKLSDMESC